MTDVDNLDAKGKLLTYTMGVAFVSIGIYLLIKAYHTLKKD